MAAHCASSVTSAAKAAAVPPASAIISTVRSASSRSRSTTSTRVPARASRIAAARPLPMPSPFAPPPVTIATLPARPASSGNFRLSLMLGPQVAAMVMVGSWVTGKFIERAMKHISLAS